MHLCTLLHLITPILTTTNPIYIPSKHLGKAHSEKGHLFHPISTTSDNYMVVHMHAYNIVCVCVLLIHTQWRVHHVV